MFDKPIVRFEWGTAKAFASDTKRTSSDLKALVDILTGMDKLILQASFTDGKNGNATPVEIKNWIKKVGEIRPRVVHLLGVEAKGVKGLPVAKLEQIAADLVEATGVPAQVFAAEAVPA